MAVSDRQPLKINWPVAFTCAAIMIFVFGTQNTAMLGGAAAQQPVWTAIRVQAIDWTLWLIFLPLVFRVGAEGRKARLSFRNAATQVLASICVCALYIAVRTTALYFVEGSRMPLLWMLNAMLSLLFAGTFLRYWMIAAAYHALAYHRDARERDAREAALVASVAEARIESIEGRLRPHFLFNTLNTITALMRKDPDAASAMMGNLSDLLRASLDGAPGHEVTLATEAGLLRQYAAIQETRFGDRLRFVLNISPEVTMAYVPQMILQPLVENAVTHGIAPREAAGTVTIEASRHDARLRVAIRDDGVGLGHAPLSTRGKGLGMSATRARLAHLYGSDATFSAENHAAGGTIVTIELPYHLAPRSANGVHASS